MFTFFNALQSQSHPAVVCGFVCLISLITYYYYMPHANDNANATYHMPHANANHANANANANDATNDQR
jgi:hypothetical protein